MSPAPALSVLSLLLEALAVLNSCCKTQLESVVSSGIGAQLVCGYVLYLVLHKQYKFKNKFRNCHWWTSSVVWHHEAPVLLNGVNWSWSLPALNVAIILIATTMLPEKMAYLISKELLHITKLHRLTQTISTSWLSYHDFLLVLDMQSFL